MYRVVVFASAGGGNFEAVVKGQTEYGYSVTGLVVDRECGAIDKARKYGIAYDIVEKKGVSKQLMERVPQETDLIVLCGWLTILQSDFLDMWKGKIINIHPSLLPKYGGKGMYGVKVHEAVLRNHEEYTGCTVHFVEERVDEGEIILQDRLKIDYEKNFTPWQLGGEVFKLENGLIVKAINKLMNYQNQRTGEENE